MPSYKLEQADKLANAFKSLYTFYKPGYNFRFIGKKCTYTIDDEDESLLNFKLALEVQTVEYALSGDKGIDKVTGAEYDKKDYTKYTVKETTQHELEFSIDIGTLGIVSENQKRKSAINSARSQTCLAYYKAGFKVWANVDDSYNKYSTIYVSLIDNTIRISKDFYLSLTGLLKAYNIYDKYAEYLPDSEDEEPVSEQDLQKIKEYKINSKAIKKLRLVSKGAFKPTSDYFDANLLDFLLHEYYVDYDQHHQLYNQFEKIRNCDIYNVATPFDYAFMDQIDCLIHSLETVTQDHVIIKSMYDYKRNPGYVSSAAVDAAIKRFYHMQDDEFHNIQSAKESNTLTMLSQANTVYFFDYDDDQESWEKQRVYNKYFTGVLDPVRTVDGKLINKKNEFSLDATITQDSINLTVIDIKTGKEVDISYEDYVFEPILVSRCYNDSTHKLVKDNNMFIVSQYCEYDYVSSIEELREKYPTLKYVRKKTNALSYATAMIPFTNRMVPTRSTLSSVFLSQSIPVQGAQPPIVYTKMGKKIYEKNPDNTMYNLKESGTVIDIKDQYVKVKTRSGTEHLFGPSSSYISTASHTTSLYKPVVSIGQKVKEGDLLITSNSFVDGEFTTMVPVVVAFNTFEGREHEDGIILSETAAKRFGHVTMKTVSRDFKTNSFYSFKYNDNIVDKSVPITKADLTKVLSKQKRKKANIVYTHEELEAQDKVDRKSNLNEWSLIKPGTYVTAGSLLFEFYEFDKDEIYSSGVNRALGNQTLKYARQILRQIRVPYNVRKNALVKSVSLRINGNEELFDQGSIVQIPETLSLKELKDQLATSDYKLPGAFGITSEENIEAYKFFKALGENQEKDNLAFLNQRRKRGQALWSISDEDHAIELDVLLEYVDELTDERLGAKLSNFYASKGVNTYIIPDDETPSIVGLKDENGNDMKLECIISSGTTFSRQNPGQIDECQLGLIGKMTWEKIVKVLDKPTQKAKAFLDKLYPNGWDWDMLKKQGETYGYCRILVDYFDSYYTKAKIKELYSDLGLQETYYLYLPKEDKTSDQKCTVGITSMMRLHFIQETKQKLTTDVYIATDDDNINYTDLHKDEGQKIGNMEAAAAMANNEYKLLEDIAKQNGQQSKGAIYQAALTMIGLGLAN